VRASLRFWATWLHDGCRRASCSKPCTPTIARTLDRPALCRRFGDAVGEIFPFGAERCEGSGKSGTRRSRISSTRIPLHARKMVYRIGSSGATLTANAKSQHDLPDRSRRLERAILPLPGVPLTPNPNWLGERFAGWTEECEIQLRARILLPIRCQSSDARIAYSIFTV